MLRPKKKKNKNQFDIFVKLSSWFISRAGARFDAYEWFVFCCAKNKKTEEKFIANFWVVSLVSLTTSELRSDPTIIEWQMFALSINLIKSASLLRSLGQMRLNQTHTHRLWEQTIRWWFFSSNIEQQDLYQQFGKKLNGIQFKLNPINPTDDAADDDDRGDFI